MFTCDAVSNHFCVFFKRTELLMLGFQVYNRSCARGAARTCHFRDTEHVSKCRLTSRVSEDCVFVRCSWFHSQNTKRNLLLKGRVVRP